MKTEIITCKDNLNGDGIKRAGRLLREGCLVGIPTETVYGLAANALNRDAVINIFRAKGRPQDNPLIIHLADREWLPRYAVDIPDSARLLMDAFWPGPLTIILKKSPVIPDIVSAGLPTAAFRFPSHPVAAAIIRESGVPIAAPSANLSGSPSPTTAAHVLKDLDGRIDAVVDGGACGVGLESTVISLSGGVPTVLRPGGITPKQIQSVLGRVEIDRAVLHRLEENRKAASPGMKYKHYAPKAHVIIVKGSFHTIVRFVNDKGTGNGALCFDGEEKEFSVPCVTYGAAGDSEEQARRLFGALRRLDEIGLKTVYARCPQTEGVGLAVYNRLLRAAGFEVIQLP